MSHSKHRITYNNYVVSEWTRWYINIEYESSGTIQIVKNKISQVSRLAVNNVMMSAHRQIIYEDIACISKNPFLKM
jgi:hypothetical protein